jgi:hypothetical protein
MTTTPQVPIRSRIRRLPALTLLAALILVAGCGSDDDSGPTAPETSGAARVLVLQDEGTETRVMEILTAAGIDAELGPLYHEYGAGDLDRYDAVVFLNCVDYGHGLPDTTQQKYVDYLAAGGGIVTMEWLLYYDSRNEILTDVLPVQEGDDYDYEPETYTRMLDHPIAAGLPRTFPTGDDTTAVDWTWVEMIPDTDAAKEVEVVFTGSQSGPVVVAGRHGAGRAVCWGTAGVYDGEDVWSAPTERLLVNIVRWIAGE